MFRGERGKKKRSHRTFACKRAFDVRQAVQQGTLLICCQVLRCHSPEVDGCKSGHACLDTQ